MKAIESIEFYQENQEFIFDLQDYLRKIKFELKYIVNEISGNKLNENNFYIVAIPFLPSIEGVLVSENDKKYFECDGIRSILGESLKSKEIFEAERNSEIEDYELDWNIKKCEIYGNNLLQYPLIQRFGATSGRIAQSKLEIEIKSMLKKNNCFDEETLFVSNHIDFGPFFVFFITKLNSNYYISYRERVDVDESNDNRYKYFLDTIIDNFHDKWLEFIYYGLNYSTTDYISGSQAIIRASANDMFESRGLPQEYILTQISNCLYEGCACKGKIVFTDEIKSVVDLKESIPIQVENIKKIRKMLEMTNKTTCLVASLIQKNIVGIDSVKEYPNSYVIEFIDKNTWNFSYGNISILKYIEGKYRLPEMKIDKKILCKRLKEKFGENYNPDIMKIVDVAVRQKHGTMVIISKEAEEETKNIIREGKGIALTKVNLIKVNQDLIYGLCSIDGAIMISPDGCCEGIGLILSNPSGGKGSPDRGARYNSALNYVENHKKSIAIVVSEDGMVDVL